jgi:hypothetical protein
MANDFWKKRVAPAVADILDFGKAMASPAQGVMNLARNVPVIAYGAIRTASPKVTFTQGIEEANRVIPRASFATNATNRLVDRGVLPQFAKTVTKVGEAAGPMALGGLGKIHALEIARPIPRLLGYSAIRGTEGAAYNFLDNTARTGDLKESARQIPKDLATGALVNTALSPRLTKQAFRQGRDSGELMYKVRPLVEKLNKSFPGNRIIDRGKGGVNIKSPMFNEEIELDNQELLNRVLGREATYIYAKPGKTKLTYDAYQTGNLLSVEPDNPKFAKQLQSLSGMRPAFADPDLLTGGLASKVNKRITDAQTGKPVRMSRTEEVGPKLAAEESRYLASNNKSFREATRKWLGAREAAKTTATQRVTPFTKLDKNTALEVIRAAEDPHYVATPKAQSAVKALRKAYNELYQEAQKAGIDMKYVDNYVTHIWQQSPEEVAQLYRSAQGKFPFAKNRTVPTYDEGVKVLGLTPKYDNPAEIMQEYVKRMEEMKANVAFLGELQKRGLLVDAATGAKLPDFAPVDAPGLPRDFSTIGDGKYYVGSYYAPREIAEQIRRILSPEMGGTGTKIMKGAGWVSGKVQDITMSGGIPKTPINAWSAAQAIKEVTAGRLKSPLVSIFRSLSGKKSVQFFQENAEQIKKMQRAGITVNTEYDASHLIDKGWIQNTFGKSVGEVWSRTVNQPTFKRFMPMLQVNFFNDIEQAALRIGKSPDEAIKIAAQATRNFYGLGDMVDEALESRFKRDLKKAVIFAPKYRQSMVNFWVNNLKALKNPLALENRANATFVVGATLTYLMMNQKNKEYTGKNMWENPKGKEDKLLVPLGDGYTLGIPFLSSIATVPRTGLKIGKNLLESDYKQSALEAKSFFSQIVKGPLDVWQNENYYGGEIYKDTDTPAEKNQKIAKYLFNPLTGQYGHPYIKAGAQLQKGEKPGYQIASQALELPLRFYDTEKMRASEVYEFGNKQGAEKTKQYQAIKNQVKVAIQNGADITQTLEGVPQDQRKRLVSSVLEDIHNQNLSPVEKAFNSLSKEQKTQYLQDNPGFTPPPNYQSTNLSKSDLQLYLLTQQLPNFTKEQQDFMVQWKLTGKKPKIKKGRKPRVRKAKVSVPRVPKIRIKKGVVRRK